MQLNKDYLFMGLMGLLIVLVAAALVLWLLSYRKKYDRNVQLMYKRIMKSNDTNEIFNLFNQMMKQVYHISLKANSRNQIINRLGDQPLTGHVLEIMDEMENGKTRSELNDKDLKTKIKLVYKSLRERRNTDVDLRHTDAPKVMRDLQ